MDRNQQTNLAAGIGAAAIVAKWACGLFGYDLQIGGDVLGGITVLAGAFCAWKIGKKDKTSDQQEKTT